MVNVGDPLESVHDALRRHDWQAALDASRGASVDVPSLEADRLDSEAEAAWWLGRLDECIAAREAAYRIYDEQDDHRRAGQCAVWLWEHHAICARPAAASGWLRRARRALDGDTESVAYGNLILREAEMAHGAGDLDRAGELATTALDLGRRLRSTDLEAEALQTQGRILIDRGNVDDGMAHLDEAMLFAGEGRLGPFATGKVYCSLIAACEELGDFDRAAEWTDATLRWAQQHPFAIFPGICRLHRAIVLKRRGVLGAAEEEAARACEELRESHVANSAAAWAEVGDIRRRLGQLDQAEGAFARSQEVSGSPCGGLALLRLAQGRIDEAMTIITSCVARQSNPLGRAGLLAMLVQIAVGAGELDAAAPCPGRARDDGRHLRNSFASCHRAVDSRPADAGGTRPSRVRGPAAGRRILARTGCPLRGSDGSHASRSGVAHGRRRGRRDHVLRRRRPLVRPDRRAARCPRGAR